MLRSAYDPYSSYQNNSSFEVSPSSPDDRAAAKMFRAQANRFDEAVAKATDENLTSENWEFIMDVCDKVLAEESGAKDVVASLIKRLAHRNANVQLYTLELANALSQNCGAKMHRELSSRSFTDAMLRLAGERTTHQQVKAKILERMAEWTEMFSSNPDLGIMEQQYMRLKSQNPNLYPPSKPHKHEITDVDRRREEDELQMALALSIKERQTDAAPAASSSQQGQSSHSLSAAGQTRTATATAPKPVPSGTTAATVSRVRALYDFQPSEAGELQFRKGDIIAVLESVFKDWWKGSLRGQTGIFPLNYVEKLSDPTPEELQREAHMEAEVFAEIKNVEKLLTLLSTSSSELNVQDNEEITTLYHSTLAIRPKLIELIGKYSQKKDEFTQLNEKFIKARKDYENLLEASMSQPTQPSYGPGPPGQTAGVGYPYGSGARPYSAQGARQDPQRYYTPGPAQAASPVELASDYQPPPSGGSAPFYFVGGQQPHPSPAPQYQAPASAGYPPSQAPSHAPPTGPGGPSGASYPSPLPPGGGGGGGGGAGAGMIGMPPRSPPLSTADPTTTPYPNVTPALGPGGSSSLNPSGGGGSAPPPSGNEGRYYAYHHHQHQQPQQQHQHQQYQQQQEGSGRPGSGHRPGSGPHQGPGAAAGSLAAYPPPTQTKYTVPVFNPNEYYRQGHPGTAAGPGPEPGVGAGMPGGGGPGGGGGINNELFLPREL